MRLSFRRSRRTGRAAILVIIRCPIPCRHGLAAATTVFIVVILESGVNSVGMC